ncbi:DNA-binding GntR family transcriptional regulator [Leifsonia sp. 563]|uniref:GntR family transcriptional regulator n=1 Tax=Leifsonia sp. 563 TaxID=3156412 RepID=UPI003392A439
MHQASPLAQSPSASAYAVVRDGLLEGAYEPGSALKPAALAAEMGVSLTVVREALAHLSGEGLIERRTNRGFFVPQYTSERWTEVVNARLVLEPAVLELAIRSGSLEWESRVVAAHHRLSGTPLTDPTRLGVSKEWRDAHAAFHRALLEGSGNAVLLEATDRLWLESEVYRQWSVAKNPGRDFPDEHAALAEHAVRRDADAAVKTLRAHITRTLDDLQLVRSSPHSDGGR